MLVTTPSESQPSIGCLKVSSKSSPAISRGFLSPVGVEIVCAPSFADIVIDGEYRTAIRFTVEPRGAVIPSIAAEQKTANPTER